MRRRLLVFFRLGMSYWARWMWSNDLYGTIVLCSPGSFCRKVADKWFLPLFNHSCSALHYRKLECSVHFITVASRDYPLRILLAVSRGFSGIIQEWNKSFLSYFIALYPWLLRVYLKILFVFLVHQRRSVGGRYSFSLERRARGFILVEYRAFIPQRNAHGQNRFPGYSSRSDSEWLNYVDISRGSKKYFHAWENCRIAYTLIANVFLFRSLGYMRDLHCKKICFYG